MADTSKNPSISPAELANSQATEDWARQMTRTAHALVVARDAWADLLGVPCVVEKSTDGSITIRAHQPETVNGSRRTNGAAARAD